MAAKINSTEESQLYFIREDVNLASRDMEATTPSINGKVALLFADPYDASGAQTTTDFIANFFKSALKKLTRGGSISVPCDLRTLTPIAEGLEAAGFKQLRFIQAVSEVEPQGFYPDNNRKMRIMAVKGGGSTFNDLYNNGHFPRPSDGSAKGTTPQLEREIDSSQFLISEILSIHSNPGDIIACASPAEQNTIQKFCKIDSIHLRTKPIPPPKKNKALAG